MTLPPPPESFFDGGEPQSKFAPGDTGRELLHEVKNLHQSVVLLSPAILRLKRRQRLLWASFALSLVAIALALGYSRWLQVEQSRHRHEVAYVACEQDRQRGEIEIDILASALLAQQDNPEAVAFYKPRIEKLESLQKDCDLLYPQEGEPGWPDFWSAGEFSGT